MRKQEAINIVRYLYDEEERLIAAVNDCSYRFVRRSLDSVDLLEEIIAKENLKYFHYVSEQILRILKLTVDEE